MEERCIANVVCGGWGRIHRCGRKAWKDGYCKQHHPETVEQRRKKSEDRFQEKLKNSPHKQLQNALLKVSDLESENAELKRQVEEATGLYHEALVGGDAARFLVNMLKQQLEEARQKAQLKDECNHFIEAMFNQDCEIERLKAQLAESVPFKTMQKVCIHGDSATCFWNTKDDIDADVFLCTQAKCPLLKENPDD